MSATTEFTPGQPERKGFYRRMRVLARIVCALVFFKLDVQGLDNIPTAGPALLASNHLSFWDIPSVALIPRRMLHFMAKSEYARNGFARWFFTNLEAFFVRRGEGDMAAFRNSLAVLKAGQLLIIYPEGHRSDTHALIPAHEGTVLIALKANVPVIPIATWGSEWVGKGFRFGPWSPTIHVRYGAPLTLTSANKRPTKDDLALATTTLMGSIAGMLPDQYRGVYADAARRLAADEVALAVAPPVEEVAP